MNKSKTKKLIIIDKIIKFKNGCEKKDKYLMQLK